MIVNTVELVYLVITKGDEGGWGEVMHQSDEAVMRMQKGKEIDRE